MLQEKVVKGWSGWVMVGVLLAALAGSIVVLASSSDVPGNRLADRGRGGGARARRRRLVRLHGRAAEYRARRAAVRQLPGLDQDAGLLVGESADDAPARLAQGAQLRERQAEGQRPHRQSDRNRRDRRLARGRDRRSRVPGRRLRALRARPDGIGRPESRDELPVRRARRGTAVAARIGVGGLAAAAAGDPGSSGRRRASR